MPSGNCIVDVLSKFKSDNFLFPSIFSAQCDGDAQQLGGISQKSFKMRLCIII